MDLPYSLQETCLLYLVGKLDSYPPETLSLLPAHLRHQLLRRLSAFDLQKVELETVTPITAGLDASTYWKALFEYVKRVFDPYCDNKDCKACYHLPELGYKMNFLFTVALHIPFAVPHRFCASLIAAKLFLMRSNNAEISLPCAKLFCLPVQYPISKDDNIAFKYMQTTFNSSGLSYYHVSLGLVIPNRLKASPLEDQSWNDDSPECAFSLIKILVEHFSYCSRLLPLNDRIPNVYESDPKRLTIVKQYLSHAETVRFSPWLHDTEGPFKCSPEFWRNVLTSNFCSEMRCVSKLDLDCRREEESFRRLIERLSPYLALPTSGLSPYKGLKEIEIHGLCDKRMLDGSADHPLYKLAAIIDNQDQLKLLHIHGEFRATSQCAALMMAIARTVEKSSFENLKIHAYYSSDWNVDLLSKIMLTYLFSPTLHKQSFTLISSDKCKLNKKKLTVREKKTIGEKLKKTSVEGQNKKSLVLEVSDSSLLLPLFSQLPSVVTVERVSFCSYTPLDSRFSSLPNIAANAIDLKYEIYRDCKTYELDSTLKTLILNDKIKDLSVEVPLLRVHERNFVSSLSAVVTKHMENFQTLCSIAIRDTTPYDFATTLKESRYNTQCEALVSLAQVVPLELNLATYDVDCPFYIPKYQYFCILFNVWKKRNPLRKFSKIILPDFSKIEDDSMCDMAEEIINKTYYPDNDGVQCISLEILC